MARAILDLEGHEESIGVHWADGFATRHEARARTHRGRVMDCHRVETFDPRTLHDFYRLFLRVVTKKHIQPEDMTNMGETGVQGETSSDRLFGDALAFRLSFAASSAALWVTILECILATGRRGTPVVIFNGKRPYAQWFPREVSEWEYIKKRLD
jgi:4-hydroxybenzoate polyprenyltransferase